MSKYNLGIIKTSLFSNLNESVSIKGFINLLKESALLKLEFSILDNIENKHIVNEDLAIKYIDENIKLLKNGGYTKELFEAEHNKLLPLIEGVKFSKTQKKELYEHIHNLLYESLEGKKVTNVNKLHEAFSYVLDFLKNNEKKQTIVETVDVPQIPKELKLTDYVIKAAIREFNDKYSSLLSNDEILVFNSVLYENDARIAKEKTFNAIKEETLNSLKEYVNELTIKTAINGDDQRDKESYISRVNESIENIEKRQYVEQTYLEDVVSFIDLKSDLSS